MRQRYPCDAADDSSRREFSGDLRRVLLAELRDAMVAESRAYFREMLTQNLGAAHVIDADFLMINQRLAELRESSLVEIDPDGGYRLTASGRDLLRALAPLQAWATRWARSR